MTEIIKIDRKLKEKLADLAVSAYPCECCAALFTKEGGSIDDYCLLANMSAGPGRYSIDPAELYECELAYREKGYEIAGFFHSHPDAPAVMSKEDERNVIPSMLYLVASVSSESCRGMRLWRMDGVKEA
ncbi:MAG: M67 family metallopeptidase [Lachnospiraceae bacterium]|nr:M67 family metallopeptidase [Lachnospiraceae bacterium]